MNKAYLNSGGTKESDEVLTPRYGVWPIIKHLKKRGYKNIWCPFDKEDSAFVRVLKEYGFIVIDTHIENGNDFFDLDMNLLRASCDCIVSNPPFSIKDKILKRLYEIGLPFAIILPQNSLQSIKRVDMFKKHGLEYLGFDRRINYYTRGDLTAWKPANHFASGYFCRNVLPSPFVLEKLMPFQEPYK
ncbi:MAG: tRNA (adenine-N(6)-)-methyltransferase [Thalassobium sp.]|nr:MAG: tRNA (adenine-N(6)-)-methyltransferase [Thalassobium sp.]